MVPDNHFFSKLQTDWSDIHYFLQYGVPFTVQQGVQPGLGGQGAQPLAAASSGVQDLTPSAQHDLLSSAVHLVEYSASPAWSVAG